jgi:hypothetical protein
MNQPGMHMVQKPARASGLDDAELQSFVGPEGAKYSGRYKHGPGVLPVLHPLWGTSLDALVLNLLHALNPSDVRITTGEIKPGHVDRRVTIYLGDKNAIQRIEQETIIGMDGGFETAQAVVKAMAFREDARNRKELVR